MGSESSKEILYRDTIPFVPDVKVARVIKVYDGDTFTVGFFSSHSEKPCRISVRLLGIDAPEINSKDFKRLVKAKSARDFLSSLIMGKTVILSDVSLEKYGRLLANVHCDGLFINQVMLDNNLVVLYGGGAREKSV